MRQSLFKFGLSIVILVTSAAFALRAQEETHKKPKPIEIRTGNTAQQLRDSMEVAKRLFDEELRKADSLHVERMKNYNVLEKNYNELKQANVVQKKAINRLVYILKHFPQDSVLKLDVEYQEPTEFNDTLKKNIEREILVPQVEKKGFFKRIFSIFRRH